MNELLEAKGVVDTQEKIENQSTSESAKNAIYYRSNIIQQQDRTMQWILE